MTDPQHLADQPWRDAQLLVDRIERRAHSSIAPAAFFDALTSDLRAASGATAVAIWIADGARRTLLSRSGVSIHLQDSAEADELTDHLSRSRWIDGRLLALQRVHDRTLLGLELHFDGQTESAAPQAMGELAEVILDLAAPVWLRRQLDLTRGQLAGRTHRDDLICSMHQGLTLTESFTSIAAAICAQCDVDRVSLMAVDTRKPRLVTTSTQARVDRRGRQVRLLEMLTAAIIHDGDDFSFTVGCPGEVQGETSLALEKYLQESGSRQIHVALVRSQDGDRVIAAIVLERFRLTPSEHPPTAEALLGSMRMPVDRAIRTAIARHRAPWTLIAGRFSDPSALHSRRRMLGTTFVIAAIVAAALWVPATLRIPVEGRVVAAQRRALFAPADAIVAEILVDNGQSVRRGQPLVVLQSRDLDLQQRTIAGSLSTARARLSTLLALRSGRNSGQGQRREADDSADEQVLREEIAALQEQAALIQIQQNDLTITSPIDGRVDRWDLHQSLAARPVTHGQHLLDVISQADGWNVQLDVPDMNVGYVLQRLSSGPCACTFRLRSDPTETYRGTITRLADIAHVDARGRSIVRASVPLPRDTTDKLRTGATVIARIHCGTRPIGFVWLRGLIQWFRTQTWL